MRDGRKNINSEDFKKLATLAEKIAFILQYAILAPSTHNSQPWLFKIKPGSNSSIVATGDIGKAGRGLLPGKPDSIEIYSDPVVQIKEADPKGRDLYISLGCAIENMAIAAKYLGIFKNLVYRIGEAPTLIAEIFLEDKGTKNESYQRIFEVIPKRVNARGLFTPVTIPPGTFQNLTTISKEYGDGKLTLHFITDKEDTKKIAELTAEGLKIAYKSPSFRKEMSQWIHNSLTRKKDGIPGYSLKMPFLISFIFPYLVRMFDIGKKLASLNYISLSSAPTIAIITSKDETREEWLETGRLAERLMLEVQSRGLQTSIFVASLEVGDLYKEVQKILGTTDIPNFLCAIGKIKGNFRTTPRHSVEEKLIK